MDMLPEWECLDLEHWDSLVSSVAGGGDDTRNRNARGEQPSWRGIRLPTKYTDALEVVSVWKQLENCLLKAIQNHLSEQ